MEHVKGEKRKKKVEEIQLTKLASKSRKQKRRSQVFMTQWIYSSLTLAFASIFKSETAYNVAKNVDDSVVVKISRKFVPVIAWPWVEALF